MVMSAGVALGETVFDDKWHFIKEQLLPFGIGLVTFIMAMVVPYQVWKRFAVGGVCGGSSFTPSGLHACSRWVQCQRC